MKLKLIFSLAALLAIAALIYGYTRLSRERNEEAQGEEPVTANPSVAPATNGAAVVNLDEQAQKRVGLRSAALAPATLAPELKCYGRVLDSSSLIGLLSNVATAQTAADASAKEFQRVQTLFAQGQNASTKSVELAEAAMKRDRIALQAAEDQLLATWGKPMVDRPDLPDFVRALATLEKVLVRLDLPAGEFIAETPAGARLVGPSTNQPVTAEFLGRAPGTDPQVQGQGFLFQVRNGLSRLTPGLAITGFLQLPGPSLQGVIVPESAIVRDGEQAWAYVQTGPTNFTRREINQQYPVATGWFVTSGVLPNERVVTTASQTLLSEERKTEIKVGD